MYSIAEQIAAQAAARGWASVLSFDAFETNIETGVIYPPDQFILTYDYNLTPTVKNGVVLSWRSEVMFALGRKAEAAGTSASVTETHQQKYERRLKALTEELVAGLLALQCATGYTLTMQPMVVQPNKYDTNIDFVYTRVTFAATA